MAKRNSQGVVPVEKVPADESKWMRIEGVPADENAWMQTFDIYTGSPTFGMVAVVDMRYSDADRLVGSLVAVRVSVVDLWPNKLSAKAAKKLHAVERVDLYWLGGRGGDGVCILLPFRPQQRVRVARGQREGRWSILGTVRRIENILYVRQLPATVAAGKVA